MHVSTHALDNHAPTKTSCNRDVTAHAPRSLVHIFALLLLTDHNNTKHHTEKRNTTKLHDFQHAMLLAQQKAQNTEQENFCF